jgi:hypothetical protein
VGKFLGLCSEKLFEYILKEDAVQANRELPGVLSVGKGCIRFSNLKEMDMDVIRKLLEDTENSKGNPC